MLQEQDPLAIENAVTLARSKPGLYPIEIRNLSRPATRTNENLISTYLGFENTQIFRSWVIIKSKLKAHYEPIVVATKIYLYEPIVVATTRPSIRSQWSRPLWAHNVANSTPFPLDVLIWR